MTTQRNILEFRSPEDQNTAIYSRAVEYHVPFNVGDEVNLIAQFRKHNTAVIVDKVEWRMWEESGAVNVKCVVFCAFSARRRLAG